MPLFAVDYFGVVPDLVSTAKALTNGAIPMGAAFASRKIYDRLTSGSGIVRMEAWRTNLLCTP